MNNLMSYTHQKVLTNQDARAKVRLSFYKNKKAKNHLNNPTITDRRHNPILGSEVK